MLSELAGSPQEPGESKRCGLECAKIDFPVKEPRHWGEKPPVRVNTVGKGICEPVESHKG